MDFYDNEIQNLKHDNINPLASKSDIARWAIVGEFGGCYMDLDTECVDSLDNIVKTIKRNDDDHIVAYATFVQGGCSSQFFMSTAKNPAWDEVSDIVLHAKSRLGLGNSMTAIFYKNPKFNTYIFPEEIVAAYHCGSTSMCMIPIKAVSSEKNLGRKILGYTCKYSKRIMSTLSITVIALLCVIIFLLFRRNRH